MFETLDHINDVLPWSEQIAIDTAAMIRTFRGSRSINEYADDLGIAPGYIARAECGSIALTIGQVAYFASRAGVNAGAGELRDRRDDDVTLADVIGTAAFGPLTAPPMHVSPELAERIRAAVEMIERAS